MCIVCGEPAAVEMCAGETYCQEHYEMRKKTIISGESGLPPDCYLPNVTPQEVQMYNSMYTRRNITQEEFAEARKNGVCPCPVCGQSVYKTEACNHMTHVHYELTQEGRFVEKERVDYCNNCCRLIVNVEGTWRDADNPSVHHYLENESGYEDVYGNCVYNTNTDISEYGRILQSVKQDGLLLQSVPAAFKDYDIIKAAVKQNGLALQYVSGEEETYVEICEYALRQNGMALQFVRTDKLDSDDYYYLSNIAVQNNGMVVQLVTSSNFNTEKEFKDVLLNAIQQNENAFQFVPVTFKENRIFARRSVSINGLILQYLSDVFKNDREIVFRAVANNGLALQYASEKLKGDKEVVLRALENNGLVLQYASDELKDDINVVRLAVVQNASALQYASDELQRKIKRRRYWT